MNPWVVRGLWALGGLMLGFLTNDYVNDGEKEALKEENERLRRQLLSVLLTFERETKKMEDVVASVNVCPPHSMGELESRLREHGLARQQIDRILAAVREANIYKGAS